MFKYIIHKQDVCIKHLSLFNISFFYPNIGRLSRFKQVRIFSIHRRFDVNNDIFDAEDI